MSSLKWYQALALNLLFLICFTLIAVVFLGRKDVVGKLALRNSLVSIGFYLSHFIAIPLIIVFNQGATALYAVLGVPHLEPAVWQSSPLWVAILCSVIGHDFCNYWTHRLIHAPLLWPIHAIHHSDTHVNPLTSYRIHFLESLVMAAVFVVLLSWLGLPPAAIAAGGVISGLYQFYVHIEADVDHGRLNWLLASPRFHRWHHADVPEFQGRNLANIIPLWDVMFGTYRAAGRCDAPMGARTAGIPDTDFIKLFLFPFAAWTGQLRRAARRLMPRSVSKGHHED